MSMLQGLFQMRRLTDAAERYLCANCSIIELHGIAAACRQDARVAGASGEIVCLLEEWEQKIYRRWNEVGDVDDPLTEEQFTEWLREQLLPAGPRRAGGT